MKLTPTTYVEATFNLFERLSSRIPAMMARIKGELDRADPDARESIVRAHLLEERATMEKEIPRPNFADISAYEHAASVDIERYLAAHPDIKRNMDDMLARFKERIRP